MSNYSADLNEDGVFVDSGTGVPVPTEPVPRPAFDELMPQSLLDQHMTTTLPPDPNLPPNPAEIGPPSNQPPSFP